jgi:hypothetical protein
VTRSGLAVDDTPIATWTRPCDMPSRRVPISASSTSAAHRHSASRWWHGRSKRRRATNASALSKSR